jgi:hypothetical protein
MNGYPRVLGPLAGGESTDKVRTFACALVCGSRLAILGVFHEFIDIVLGIKVGDADNIRDLSFSARPVTPDIPMASMTASIHLFRHALGPHLLLVHHDDLALSIFRMLPGMSIQAVLRRVCGPMTSLIA